MTRKMIKHEQIPNVSRRNVTFEKRADSLLKKWNELSILCGVDMGIIVHKQGGENNAILWSSPIIFRERLQKFLDFPNMERTKRMVTHKKFMEQTIDVEIENLLKSKKITKLKKSRHLMNKLIQVKYSNELELYQLNGLKSFVGEMLKKLRRGIMTSMLLENLKNDQWFIKTMLEEQGITNILESRLILVALLVLLVDVPEDHLVA
ncbi:hypothetical protein Pfo_000473 [Paulownia fortunei]|nr:hypothetical protein Pfo_000473 [Paulownia fortunei]